MAIVYKGRVIDTNYRSLKGGAHKSRGHIQPNSGNIRDLAFESSIKLKSNDLVEFTRDGRKAKIVRVLPKR